MAPKKSLEPVLELDGEKDEEIWTSGSPREDLKAARDPQGEGKNEASSLLTKHPNRSHPNITNLRLLPTNNRTRPKKIKFPQPSDSDLDIEDDDDDDEMQTNASSLLTKHPDGSHPNVTNLHHLPTNNRTRPKKIKFPQPSDSDLDIEDDDDDDDDDDEMQTNGSKEKELKAAGDSQGDDSLSHGVEHPNVNDPEKTTVNEKKRKLPCSICLSLDHNIGSCQCRESCPAGTTLAPHYDIVCKCCGELGGHPNHKNWEGRAVRKICGRCHSSGHWFWQCTIMPPP